MNVFTAQYQLENEKLSTGGLFRVLQDISTTHCDQIGLGAEVIGPKGLMWVALRQYVSLERYPLPGEKISINTWPGKTRHMLFPRFYVLFGENGETIGKGSTLWSIVDMNTRRMISSTASYGIEVEGLVTGEETRLPSAPAKLPLTDSAEFTVPEKYLDINQHMNNTTYYDMAENCLGKAAEGRCLKEAMTEYVSEARKGDEMKVLWGQEQNRFYITGEGESTVFKMSLEYL